MGNDLEAPVSPPSYSFDENFKLIRPTDIGESFQKPIETSKFDDNNDIYRRSQKSHVSRAIQNGEFANSARHDQNQMNMYSSFKSATANGYSNSIDNSNQKFTLNQNQNQNSNQLFSEEFLNYLSMIH